MEARTGGYTLQELLIALGLASILYAITIPVLRAPGATSEADRFTQAVTRALHQARSTAIASGERVTFCGSLDAQSCSRVWSHHVWRGSLGRPYLRFRVTGAAVEYGRFSYCPADDNPRAFRQLVINRVGRVYRDHEPTRLRKHCRR